MGKVQPASKRQLGSSVPSSSWTDTSGPSTLPIQPVGSVSVQFAANQVCVRESDGCWFCLNLPPNLPIHTHTDTHAHRCAATGVIASSS